MTSTARTDLAFGKYRGAHGPDQAMNPNARRYSGDTDQMGPEDGLVDWVDGPMAAPGPKPAERPDVPEHPYGQRLWVVTTAHVRHAAEACVFGAKREAGAIKHSNLTGGGSAFAGGELVFLDQATIAITGSSGRYRIRGFDEMAAIERAFLQSGYNVWSAGYNQDVNRPNIFGMSDLEWVAP